MRKTNFQRTISMTEINDKYYEITEDVQKLLNGHCVCGSKDIGDCGNCDAHCICEDDIDDQREIQRERDFDRIQQSIETDSGNTT